MFRGVVGVSFWFGCLRSAICGCVLYSGDGGIAGSSNGRTLGSGPSNLGSNPSPAAYTWQKWGGVIYYRATIVKNKGGLGRCCHHWRLCSSPFPVFLLRVRSTIECVALVSTGVFGSRGLFGESLTHPAEELCRRMRRIRSVREAASDWRSFLVF